MSIESMRQARKEMSGGDVAQYGVGAISLEIGGLVTAVEVIHSADHRSTYNSLQSRIVELHNDHQALSRVADRGLLKGIPGGQPPAATFEQKLAEETSQIRELRAEQPHQLSSEAALGIFGGGLFGGVVAGVAVVYGLRKVFPRMRSVNRQSNTAEAPQLS